MQSPEVRPIEPVDVPRLAGIETAADELLRELFGPGLFDDDSTPGAQRVGAPGFVLVAGRPCVGFAQVLVEGHTAHLQQLAVDPTHGRRGLGTALVLACCHEAERRGHRTLSLTTFRDVAFNAPWYARLGFVVVDQPTGPLAAHVEAERAYETVAPRVAMSCFLGPDRPLPTGRPAR